MTKKTDLEPTNLKVSDLYDNIRLDKYLKILYPLLTQGVIQTLLRKAKIKVNNKKTESNSRVLSNDDISIYTDMSCYELKREVQNYGENIKSLANKMKTKYLIYENNDILVINKPAMLSTQGGRNITISIDHAIKYINDTDGTSLKLVHRLDKETSGILIITKNYNAARKFGAIFKERKVEKTYIAILSGIPEILSGIIKSNIHKTRNANDKFIVGSLDYEEDYDVDAHNSKEAITRYDIVSTNKPHNLSLCIFRPLTGRMHQLRHHANVIGCNILGDFKYQLLDSEILTKNLMLHAYSVKVDSVGIIKAKIPAYIRTIAEKYLF